ncbi:MAG: histidinol-phosphatase, partial [Bacteroidota bacterium]
MKKYKTANQFFKEKSPEDIQRFVSNNLAITERIASILDQKKWTQKDLAKAMDTTDAVINKWMSGMHDFTLRTIAKLEVVLETHLVTTIETTKEEYKKLQNSPNVLQEDASNLVYEYNQLVKAKDTKRLLILDRDGTLIKEPADDPQIDSLEKLHFYPKVFRYLSRIAAELDFELIMITNQDGLGTEVFPEAGFWAVQNKMVETLKGEGIEFSDVLIDRSFPADQAPTRKPRTGLLTPYIEGDYDLANSFVIGDRLTDMELAKNLGAKGIWINNYPDLATSELSVALEELRTHIALESNDWEVIYRFLKLQQRTAKVQRTTKETDILIELNLDGSGVAQNETGLGFFDHMLDQLARHSGCDLTVRVKGDLHIDEHHTIEDTAIALGDAFYQALGSKLGIERYGYCLPMDDCL